MIKILVLGPVQVGSTRLYNLLRLIYEAKGYIVSVGWNKNNGFKIKKNTQVIIKKYTQLKKLKNNVKNLII